MGRCMPDVRVTLCRPISRGDKRLKLGRADLETDTPISEICFEAGFNNIASFNRTFLR